MNMTHLWDNAVPGTAYLAIVAFWILTAVVNIAFAIAVQADAQMLWNRLRRKPFFVGGGIWALATLLGGVFVAAIYWIIHHSTLRPRPAQVDAEEEQQPPPGA
ncbi:MAG TPA: hypothetical protein VGM54_02340 [Chthoniobacter sp.]|jgi:hypothetical protein